MESYNILNTILPTKLKSNYPHSIIDTNKAIVSNNIIITVKELINQKNVRKIQYEKDHLKDHLKSGGIENTDNTENTENTENTDDSENLPIDFQKITIYE